MWFLTVGMHEGGFTRLVRWVDQIAAMAEHETLAQIADTPYTPTYLRWFRYASQERMIEAAGQSELVIAHCGAGSVLDALRLGKPLVVVPRLRRLGEHHDDHQLELARYLAQEGLASIAESEGQLREALSSARVGTGLTHLEHRNALIAYVCDILSEAARS